MHACKLDGYYSDTWLLLLYSSPVSQCCLYFQTVAILKAINTQETPVKEKHLRSILLHSGLVSLYLKVLHKVHLTTNVWTIHPKSKRYTLCITCPIFWSVFYYEYSKTLLVRPLFVLSKSLISGVVLLVNLLLNGLHSLQVLIYDNCQVSNTVISSSQKESNFVLGKLTWILMKTCVNWVNYGNFMGKFNKITLVPLID